MFALTAWTFIGPNDCHMSVYLKPTKTSFATNPKTAVRGGAQYVVAVVVIETRSHAASSTVGWVKE